MNIPGRTPTPPDLVERQIHRWDRIASALRRFPATEEIEPVRRPCITISGTAGSGREELASLLAKKIDYEIYGRELVEHVATDLGLDKPIVQGLDERVDSEISLIFSTWMRGREIEHSDYLRSLARVMIGIARNGGAIILGRGGNFILKDLPEEVALSVRLDAPLEKRIQHVMKSNGVSEDEAARMVKASDQDRAKFIQRHFNRDINDSVAYDMTLNMDRLSIAQAVEIIVKAIAIRGVSLT